MATALALIDERGALAFSMRALAERLNVTPMALYNHVSSRRSLLSAVADDVIRAVKFDSDQGGWRERVIECFAALRKLCLTHPGLPGILEGEGIAPPSVFAPMEVTMQALQEAGLDDLSAMRTYFLLMNFTLAQAAYQARGPIAGLDPVDAANHGRIEGEGFETIEQLQMPPAWDFDATFAFGIRLVLDGVEAITIAARPRRRGGASKKR